MKLQKTWSLVLILIAGLLALWGCPKKTEVTAAPEAQQQQAQKEVAPAPAQPSPEAVPAPAVREESPSERTAGSAGGLKPIYFDFDKSFIRNDAKEIMKANAAWLKAHPQAKVKIEGNCDERGTIEYNQALGQRRAASAKRYLTDMGIKASRISLISFGKEKPVCSEDSEACLQKNRRDDIVAE